jgi:GNAT superfamily N-acetyltransferase
MQTTHPPVEVIEADLDNSDHQAAIIEMLDAYSRDPMGDGKPLEPHVRETLIPGLQQHPTTIIFLAYSNNTPVGIAVCFKGFSTFAARPLINIHDFAVLPDNRGLGIGRLMLEMIEKKAARLGCCKLTLETQENNKRARRVYEAAGYAQAVYQAEAGGSLFYSKKI